MPFQRSFFIHKRAAIEQILQKNHKHGSIPKDFNNNIDKSRSGTSKAIFVLHTHKANSVHFVDPYDHINTMDNNNEATHLANANKEHTRERYE